MENVEQLYSAAWRCFHCHEPLCYPIGSSVASTNANIVPHQSITEFVFNGQTHRVHDDCWKAIEVAERLKGNKAISG